MHSFKLSLTSVGAFTRAASSLSASFRTLGASSLSHSGRWLSASTDETGGCCSVYLRARKRS